MLLLLVEMKNLKNIEVSILSASVDEKWYPEIMVNKLTVFYYVNLFLNNKMVVVVFLSKFLDENILN